MLSGGIILRGTETDYVSSLSLVGPPRVIGLRILERWLEKIESSSSSLFTLSDKFCIEVFFYKALGFFYYYFCWVNSSSKVVG